MAPTRSRREELRERLADARLYLVCDSTAGAGDLALLLREAIAGGVDVVQLREKRLTDERLLPLARAAQVLCERLGALFILNDRPAVAAGAGADGVHVGQDDIAPDEARALVGEHALIGLSTHAPAEIDAADGAVDYIGVGPVHDTPTKPGRPAVGLELVRYAATNARVPFFAIGGIDTANAHEVLDAGAQRIVVLRAIASAEDPRGAARALREIVERARA
ncbi:MAG: thiamine phosphate synthase [Solirubrobacterales bacterium]|nr:thiamine phosphate synthase [Solirubrobacterales bacterium]